MVRDKQSISVSNNLNNILTILIYNFYTFGYTWDFACHVCLPLDLPEHLLSLLYSSLFQEYCLRCKGTDLHVTTTIAEKHQDSETLREQHWHLVPDFHHRICRKLTRWCKWYVKCKIQRISAWQRGFLWCLRPFALGRPPTNSDFPGPCLAMTQSSTEDMFTEGGIMGNRNIEPTNDINGVWKCGISPEHSRLLIIIDNCNYIKSWD